MKIETLYTATATAIGGREGQVTSSDGVLDLAVRTPKQLGGAGGDFTNPEQLFAAGYASCFDSALGLVARLKKVKTGPTSVAAEVSLGKTGNGGYGLAVNLLVRVPGVDQEVAEDLVQGAHQVCPYSNATRGNVLVNITVTTEAAV